jgi:hypothetical protein
VLVYEVMSRGQQPYSEFNTLTEVAERIKSGYRMQCPIGCPVGVHQRMMLPCWEFNASLRPGFTKLNDVLVDLGAVPHEDAKDSSGDDDVAEENGKTRKGAPCPLAFVGGCSHFFCCLICATVGA